MVLTLTVEQFMLQDGSLLRAASSPMEFSDEFWKLHNRLKFKHKQHHHANLERMQNLFPQSSYQQQYYLHDQANIGYPESRIRHRKTDNTMRESKKKKKTYQADSKSFQYMMVIPQPLPQLPHLGFHKPQHPLCLAKSACHDAREHQQLRTGSNYIPESVKIKIKGNVFMLKKLHASIKR